MSEDFYCDEAVSGRTPVEVVAETDEVLAFRHTRPFWPVHIVVIPKRHVPSLIDGAQSEDCVAATCRRAAQLSYEVILALDGHSTWASATQTAPEIIAEQNTILGAGLVNLRTSSRLVAELRGSGNR